jgi:hypothetical protein
MPMRWVVHDNGFRNLIANAANLDLAAPGVKNIFHPPTISPVRDCNQKSIGHSKNIYRRTVEPARFSASRRDYTESRQSSGEPDREPATCLLQNLTRRIGIDSNAKSATTDAATAITSIHAKRTR